jgi:hypothetical protein
MALILVGLRFGFMTLTQARCPANPSLKKHFANMPAKNALACINWWGFPRMGELLSKQDHISMRPKNSRALNPARLTRVSGLLVLRTTRSGSSRMTTCQNITGKKNHANLLHKPPFRRFCNAVSVPGGCRISLLPSERRAITRHRRVRTTGLPGGRRQREG